MTSDLAIHIQSTPMIDSHEHLHKETDYVENGPDVLADLFGMYIGDELLMAGAPFDDVVRLLDSQNTDIEARWNGIKDAWSLCIYTGFGEAVRRMAQLVYGMDEITLDTIVAAAERNHQIRQSGERLRLLRDVANLDHVQVDDFDWACLPDESGLDFFLYDLSWAAFSYADFDVAALEDETGITITNSTRLKSAMEALFAKYGPLAIAIKSQHAYMRTLAWEPCDSTYVESIFQRYLSKEMLTNAEKLCLGDWCLARGVELAIEYELPIKIHTGFLAGHGEFFTKPDRVRAAHLGPLIAHYPRAHFVLMHIAYPYSDELIALAKHHPNISLDMCWAWSINPRHAAEFIRRALHTLPINKVFAFGGDCIWPTETVGFAAQARDWLTYALQGEIDDGFISETQAIQIATRLMHQNQRAIFDLEGKRNAIQAWET